jgi:hypothetical protein
LIGGGIVATLYFYRCPFCGRIPTTGYGGTNDNSIDLFPDTCLNCGVHLRVMD